MSRRELKALGCLIPCSRSDEAVGVTTRFQSRTRAYNLRSQGDVPKPTTYKGMQQRYQNQSTPKRAKGRGKSNQHGLLKQKKQADSDDTMVSKSMNEDKIFSKLDKNQNNALCYECSVINDGPDPSNGDSSRCTHVYPIVCLKDFSLFRKRNVSLEDNNKSTISPQDPTLPKSHSNKSNAGNETNAKFPYPNKHAGGQQAPKLTEPSIKQSIINRQIAKLAKKPSNPKETTIGERTPTKIEPSIKQTIMNRQIAKFAKKSPNPKIPAGGQWTSKKIEPSIKQSIANRRMEKMAKIDYLQRKHDNIMELLKAGVAPRFQCVSKPEHLKHEQTQFQNYLIKRKSLDGKSVSKPKQERKCNISTSNVSKETSKVALKQQQLPLKNKNANAELFTSQIGNAIQKIHHPSKTPKKENATAKILHSQISNATPKIRRNISIIRAQLLKSVAYPPCRSRDIEERNQYPLPPLTSKLLNSTNEPINGAEPPKFRCLLQHEEKMVKELQSGSEAPFQLHTPPLWRLVRGNIVKQELVANGGESAHARYPNAQWTSSNNSVPTETGNGDSSRREAEENVIKELLALYNEVEGHLGDAAHEAANFNASKNTNEKFHSFDYPHNIEDYFENEYVSGIAE